MSFNGRRFRVGRFMNVKIEYDRIWMPQGSMSFNPPPLPPPHMDGDPMIRSEMVLCRNQPEEAFGGVVCVAVQHEIDHGMGVCIPWKEGSVEVPYEGDGIRAPGKKIGRNEPCPCGSKNADGSPKKYKKCCGR